MCYNVEYLEMEAKKKQQAIDEILYGADVDLPQFHFVTGFAHPEMAIVKDDGTHLYKWGLVPGWAKDMKAANDIRSKTLNAIGETVYDKPSFRGSIPSKRCVMPVTAFYEWRDVDGAKYPYRIHPADGGVFMFGCIYNSWTDKGTGDVLNTFSILTTAANPMMEKIHNLKMRMPLILGENGWEQWLDPKLSREGIDALIKPFPQESMAAYTVSKLANRSKNHRNVPEISERVEYTELGGI